MKKILIIIVIIILAVLAWKHFSRNGSLEGKDNLTNDSSTGFGPDRQSGPSANETADYSIDQKSSSVIFGTTNLTLKGGVVSVTKGSISGGNIIASLSSLKNSKDFPSGSFNLKNFPEATIALKALVFDSANSTTDNLVFRTDAELTINGVTKPISFPSTFAYRPGYMVISGSTMADWKAWGITPNDSATPISIKLIATKK